MSKNLQIDVIIKRLNLKTFQQLCSMIGTSLGKMCFHCLELPLLKFWENVFFFFETTQNRVKFTFYLNSVLFFYASGSHSFFLSKTLQKVATTPTNKKILYHFSPLTPPRLPHSRKQL